MEKSVFPLLLLLFVIPLVASLVLQRNDVTAQYNFTLGVNVSGHVSALGNTRIGEVHNLEESLLFLKSTFDKNNLTAKSVEEKLNEIQLRSNERSVQIEEQNATILTMSNRIEELQDIITSLEKQLDDGNKTIVSSEEEIEELSQRFSKLREWSRGRNEFSVIQDIPITMVHGIEVFSIGEDLFAAVATQQTVVNSTIFKWTGSGFDVFQSFSPSDRRHWEAFEINGDSYLAVSVYYNSGISSYATNSVIYKWNGNEFGTLQAIPTFGAFDMHAFVIGGDTYLAVANYQDDSTWQRNSEIFKWNGASFSSFQQIMTKAATDFESAVIEGETYLVVANHYLSSHLINSVVYKWSGSSFVSYQEIATVGAYDLEFFSIEGDTYLAIANMRNMDDFSVNSVIYKWVNGTFETFQVVPTYGGTAWKSYVVAGTRFLALVNYGTLAGNVDEYLVIFKWNGEEFVVFQNIPTKRAKQCAEFSVDGVGYLFVGQQSENVMLFSNKLGEIGG